MFTPGRCIGKSPAHTRGPFRRRAKQFRTRRKPNGRKFCVPGISKSAAAKPRALGLVSITVRACLKVAHLYGWGDRLCRLRRLRNLGRGHAFTLFGKNLRAKTVLCYQRRNVLDPRWKAWCNNKLASFQTLRCLIIERKQLA